MMNNINQYSNNEIAYEVIKHFIGEDIPRDQLKKIIEDTLNFNFPIVEITDNMRQLFENNRIVYWIFVE